MKTNAMLIVAAMILILGGVLIILERRHTDVKKLMLIAVLTAMNVAGRFIFALTAGFKPVTAIVVIAGMYLGAEAGFLCGALGAFISNFYFGQGPWTLFQMFAWGILGVLAALFSGTLKKSRLLLSVYGVFAGVAFSLLMDIYTVIWTTDSFSFAYYMTCIGAAAPFTAIYALSNVIFLLAISIPFANKLEHIQKKYHI